MEAIGRTESALSRQLLNPVSLTALFGLGFFGLWALYNGVSQMELDLPQPQEKQWTPPEKIPDEVECSNCGTVYAGLKTMCPVCRQDNPWK